MDDEWEPQTPCMKNPLALIPTEVIKSISGEKNPFFLLLSYLAFNLLPIAKEKYKKLKLDQAIEGS